MKIRTHARKFAALPLFALAASLALSACAGTAGPGETQSASSATVATDPQSGITGYTGWNFPIYDIPADPAVRYGVLENGLHYAIMKNKTPQSQVVMRLGFDIGWIDEVAGQSNAAHFIEHMAFNGSTNVPEGEMIKLLERDGLAFGADTNAETFYEHTLYKLDLPRNDDALIDTGLMLMREVASELTITPEAVQRERGVLQSEIQTNNDFNLRLVRDFAAFFAPDSIYAQRTGSLTQAADTANVTAEQLRAFYKAFYRPDNAVMIVVGDVDLDAIEAKLKSRFASWEKPASEIAEVDRGSIDFDRPMAADTFVDPAVTTLVRVVVPSPYEDKPETVAAARESMLTTLSSMIMNRRFQTIARKEDSVILGGGVSSSDYFDAMTLSLFSLSAKEGKVKEAVALAENEMRRAVQHGFTQAEVAEALANMETSYRNAAQRQNTRNSVGLATGIFNTVQRERIFQTPETNLAIFEQVKPSLTAAAIHEEFTERFTASEPLIHVADKQPIEGGDAALLAAYRNAAQLAVAAPVEEALTAFAYTDFGPAGLVVSDTRVDDLGYRAIRFDNNVMLNLKKTDFKDQEILFHLRMGEGELAYGFDQPGATVVMNFLAAGGLGQHSVDELQRLMAGRNVSLGLSATNDHLHTSGSTRAEDFLQQMQITAAYITDPGYRPEAEGQLKAAIPNYLAQLDASPQAVAGNRVPNIIANGDTRFGAPSGEVLLGTSFAELKAAIGPQLATAPIELTVVGDIDEQAIIDAVAQTLGALPDRKASLEPYATARDVDFTRDFTTRTLYHTGAADQGMVQVYWPTTDDDDFREEVTARITAAALRLKLLETLREELGATYTPFAQSEMSDTFDDFGYVVAAAIVAPENQSLVFETIDELARSMATDGIDEDLLTRARNPILESLTQNRRENAYWQIVLESAQLETARLDRTRQYEDILRGVTTADVAAFAREYLKPDRRLRVAIVPKPAG